MNGRIFVIIIVLFTQELFAQENYLDTFKVQPSTEKKGYGTSYLIGTADDQNVFKFVNMKKEVPKNFPQSKWIDYQKVLNGGLNSFLFEFKNYSRDISYYSLFGWGNFAAMGDSVLSIANEVFFPNRALLNKIYNWYAPEYKKAFKLLTVEEQQIYLSKVFMTEAFIKYVLIEKSTEKFDNWLKTYGLENDHYVTEFVERRVRKKQWTIADCKYWVKKVKNDFLPLLKNAGDVSTHYQVYDNIGGYFLAFKHDGTIAITDKNFVEYNEHKYYKIEKLNDSILLAENYRKNIKKSLNLNDLSRYGCFVENNPNNIVYFQVNDTVCYCSSKAKYNDFDKGYIDLYRLYDFKNKIILEDSIEGAYQFVNTGIEFFQIVNKRQNEENWPQVEYIHLIIDKDKCKLIYDPLETMAIFNPDTWEEEYRFFSYEIKDKDETLLGYYVKALIKSYVFGKSGNLVYTFDNNHYIGLCEKNENYVCITDSEKNEISRFLKVLLNERE